MTKRNKISFCKSHFREILNEVSNLIKGFDLKINLKSVKLELVKGYSLNRKYKNFRFEKNKTYRVYTSSSKKYRSEIIEETKSKKHLMITVFQFKNEKLINSGSWLLS